MEWRALGRDATPAVGCGGCANEAQWRRMPWRRGLQRRRRPGHRHRTVTHLGSRNSSSLGDGSTRRRPDDMRKRQCLDRTLGHRRFPWASWCRRRGRKRGSLHGVGHGLPVLRFLVRQCRCSIGRFGGADERPSSSGHCTVRAGHEGQGGCKARAGHGDEVQVGSERSSEEQVGHSSNGERECSEGEGSDGLLISDTLSMPRWLRR